MKKIVSMLLALCVALSFGALIACSDSSSSSKTFTASDYEKALQLNGDFKLVMNVNDGTEEVTTNFTVDGNKLEMENVQGGVVSHMYLDKVGSEYFTYTQVDGVWTKSSSDEQTYNYYKVFPSTTIRIYTTLSFEDFTYNEEEKCYVATQIGEGMTGTFKISFENKKIKKIQNTVVHTADGETTTTQIDFTYNQTINLPSVGGTAGENFVLTAENYDQLVTFSAYNCSLSSSMTGDMEMDLVFIYYNDIVVQRIFEGTTVVDEMYISKDGDTYCEYHQNDQTWVRGDLSQTEYQKMRMANDLNFLYNFEDWTYNEELSRYECARKEMGEGVVYLDAWFKVENGKITTYHAVNEGPDQYGGTGRVEYNFTIDYTEVVLTLPSVS